MSNIEQLISSAKKLSADTTVSAAGIFAFKDQYLKLVGWGTLGGVAGGALAGALGDAVGSVEAMHAQRNNAAQERGFDGYRVLVAVGATEIHLFDWVTSEGASKLYYSIERASVEVSIKKFGLSRHLYLKNVTSAETLALQGNISPISSVSNGDKTVLRALKP
ncbi:MAG: hypothetical protein WCK06_02295 [Actinomycetota bacterium]